MKEIDYISRYRRENAQSDLDSIYSFSEKYDFEIILSRWQKILITILNILTGGFGTILTPFMNKKKVKINFCRNIFRTFSNNSFFTFFFYLLELNI